MELERKKAFLIRAAYFVLIVGIAIFLCRSALPVLLPFLLACLVSLLLRPLARFLCEKCRVQRTIAAVLVVLLFYGTLAVLVTLLGVRLVGVVRTVILQLPEFYNTRIEPLLTSLGGAIRRFTSALDPSAEAIVGGYLASASASIETGITNFSMAALKAVTGYAISVPGYLINALITVIATVFLTMDLPRIRRFLLVQFSEEHRVLLGSIREHLGRTVGRYVRSYAIILLITFGELALGLSIVGVPGSIGLAALIAVFDLLPVVGSGTVLLPWAALSALSGQYVRALGLLVVYVVIVIVRNIIEPKIVGTQVGLHPIVTLLSMVVGVYIFGPVGLLGLPLTLALIISLNNAGVIHLYRDPPPEGDPTSGKPGKGPTLESAQAPRDPLEAGPEFASGPASASPDQQVSTSVSPDQPVSVSPSAAIGAEAKES